MEFCETCRKAAILGIEIPTASISSTEFFCDFVIKCTSLEIIVRNIPGHVAADRRFSAIGGSVGNPISAVGTDLAIIDVVRTGDFLGKSFYRIGRKKRSVLQRHTLTFRKRNLRCVDRFSGRIENRVARIASLFRIFQRGICSDLRLGICPCFSDAVNL